MTLSVRAVFKPRRLRPCDMCGRYIDGPHLLLYGMQDIGHKPFNLRLHADCCSTNPDAKTRAALDLIASKSNA